MKEIKKSSQFKKDYKRIKNDKVKKEELLKIVRLLEQGKEIPKENDPHHLIGDYKDYMESHIEDDLLLIWYDKIANVIRLIRLGSQSELYGNGRKR